VSVRTPRLLLRRWREEDREPFAALNSDPQVMEHFPAPLTRAASDAVVERIEAHLDEHGWGLWAVDVVDAGPGGGTGFAGFTGIKPVPPTVPCAPAVEVGWRLARWAWGHGYATEAATRALDVAFDDLGLDEVVSFTALPNTRSQAVMRRLGMQRDLSGDFDHPSVPTGHPLQRHVLYRVSAKEHLVRRALSRGHGAGPPA
jgi:ribosomal-protein-alanine N-acetyltransferase